MTAPQILAAIRRHGGDLQISEIGKLQIVDRDRVPDELVRAARERAADLKAIVREHLPTAGPADAVLAAQTLLRSRRWPFRAAPCDFPIGPAGTDCKRCGSSFLTHQDPRRGRAR